MLKKWRLNIIDSPVLTIGLSILVLLVAWQLINLWLFTLWQQTLLQKIDSVEAKQEEYNKIDKVKTLSMMNIELPDLPAMQVVAESAVISQSAQASQKNTNKLITDVTPVQTIQSFEQKSNSVPNEQSKTVVYNKNNTVKAEMNKVSAMYQQLISDSSIDIVIAWPNNNTERQNTFTFLYQCVGMKFGVLNWQETNQPKVTLAKNPYLSSDKNYNRQNQNNQNNLSRIDNSKVSDWLRIAQGPLADQEKHWLQTYNLSGTPIRLFPRAIDWRLANLIANKLNNAELTSFRAHYKYTKNNLMLTNIQLNGKSLYTDWTLITSTCSI